MKQTSSRKEYLALTKPFFLATVAFIAFTLPVNARELQERISFSSKSTQIFEITQKDNCQQVIAKRGLYVREQPTVYSSAVGIIAYGRNAEVAGTFTNNWLPIFAPLQGYVYAEWIGSCEAASPPPSNCRLVAERAIAARQEPSSDSKVLGYISSDRRVIITGQ